ncbi:MAG: hypothetical protein KGS48_14235, partial [Bacteroidetes bacterium]|nr:hypothetical protein [Bacteroidota bacterium]
RFPLPFISQLCMPGFHVFDANILKIHQLKIKHLGVANSIVYDDPNFMFNGNEKLFDYTLTWMRKLRTKCIRISEEAELSRRSYFNNLQNKIKKSLSQY